MFIWIEIFNLSYNVFVSFSFAVHMSKLHSSPTPRSENCDTNLQGEDINEQILRHENSAAGVLGLVETRHGAQASQVMLTKGVVGVVAKLGKVNDENLSQLVPFLTVAYSDYLQLLDVTYFITILSCYVFL